LARRNYSYEKRQKDLARKKKQDLKRQRKLEKKTNSTEEIPEQVEGTEEAPVAEAPTAEPADPEKTPD